MNRDAIAEPRPPGAPPAPAPGEVHVWRIRLPERRGRDVARAALGQILAGYLGETEAPQLSAEPGGKPELTAAPERLSFNLAHTAGLALVAVAAGGVAVGIDVERLRPRRDLVRLAARWLPAADAAAVVGATAAEREAVFYAAWTRHEARVKCAGTGIDGPAPGPEVVAQELAIDPGYAAALAAAGTPTFVRRLEFLA